MYKRLYQKGERFPDILAVIEAIRSGKYTYWHDKPMHPGWMWSQHLGTLIGAAGRGELYQAIPTPEYYKRYPGADPNP